MDIKFECLSSGLTNYARLMDEGPLAAERPAILSYRQHQR